MISEFRPKNIMISNFWAKKLPNSGMVRLCSIMFNKTVEAVYRSSIGPTLESMTSRRQIQDGGPHDVRSKMAAPRLPIQDGGPTKPDPRGGPHEVRYKMAAPVTRSVTPRRVSQRPRPREGSLTS